MLAAISPSSASVGGGDLNMTVFGSHFHSDAAIQWNGSVLITNWVSAGELNATVPAANLASVGMAQVNVVNPSPSGGTSASKTFSITNKTADANAVRAVPGVGDSLDMVWDAMHGKFYLSTLATDTTSPNAILAVDPVAATVAKPVVVGKNPRLLSISSDNSFLWVSNFDDHSVQRLSLPGLVNDISFPVPKDSSGNAQQAISLEAARDNAHTLAIVAGNSDFSEPGNGVYVFDDATQRPTSVHGYSQGGPLIDWIQWGANDSTIYGDATYGGSLAALHVTAAGAALQSLSGSGEGPAREIQFNPGNGLLYYNGWAFNSLDGSYAGIFGVPVGERACTADSDLQRYYCFLTYSSGGTDLLLYELWVFDLNNYGLLERLYFGTSASLEPSSITGAPEQVVRWGNSGLAVRTATDVNEGAGGLFLIDGPAINPKASLDASSGTGIAAYVSLTSMAPVQATVGSNDVTVVVHGNNFTPDTTIC